MLILGLLGMYFDAVVVEVKTFLLLFRLAMAKLWLKSKKKISVGLCLFRTLEYISSENEKKILSLEHKTP